MKQTWKKMSSLFLVVCMIFTVLPMTSYAAEIDKPRVYFGKNGSGIPILWYIVATDANSVTLWTTANMGNQKYDSSEHDSWSGSDICTWLNSTFLNDSFTSAEQDAMAAYGSTEGPNSIDISQKIVLPSVEEIGTGSSTGTWGINQDARELGNNWWLRTPITSNNAAAYVKYDGEVSSNDSTAPVLSAGSANRISDTVSTIGFTTTEDGEAFYTVVNSGTTPEPTKEEIATGTSLGLVSGTVTGKTVDLTAGEKDIYVVVKDASGNLSDPLKIEAVGYVLPNTNVDTNSNINDGINFTSLLSGGGKVYYGSYRHILEPFHGMSTLHSTWEQQDTPVLWRIMGEEPGSPDHGITLIS